MWKIAFILLVLSDGILSESEDDESQNKCHRNPFGSCRPDPFPDVPETIEDFESACVSMRNYSNCSMAFLRECPIISEDPDTVELLQAFNNVTIEICTKDTVLYDVMSVNVKCIKSSLEYHLTDCPPKADDVQVSYRGLLDKTGADKRANTTIKSMECLNIAADYACFSSHVSENCGKPAKAAVSEIAKKLGFLKDCPEDIKNDLVKKVEMLPLTEEEKEEIIHALKL